MHLQFKLLFSGKIQQNKINYRNMPKGNENVPNLNMLSVWYCTKASKKIGGKKPKKIFCRVPNEGHSAKRMPLDVIRPLPIFVDCLPLPISFAECRSLPSAIFCRVQRSAKQVFAECPKFGTRQRFLHSANHVFPAVSSN
jgi:hypothetical protein